MQSPLPTLSLILLYLFIVRFGPCIMKDRPAFEMKPLLFVFNSAIVVLYVYLVYEVSIVFLFFSSSFFFGGSDIK